VGQRNHTADAAQIVNRLSIAVFERKRSGFI
jgi:hypothetical protein